MRPTHWLPASLILSACAHHPPAVAREPTRPPATTPPLRPATAPSGVARDLTAQSPYEALVAAIADEDEAGPPATPTRHCLLAPSPTGFRLEADLAVAVRPVAAPPDELDGSLAEVSSVRVLSRWGRHGLGPGALTLAALTEAPPTRAAWVLVLTDRGAYVRPTDGLGSAPREPSPDAMLRERLRAIAALDATVTWYVSAEKTVPVSRLAFALSELTAEHRGPVVLAVALAPDTTLPPPRAHHAAPPRCPDGLAPSDALEGNLSVAALTAAVSPLAAHAARCLERADAAGAAGGRLTLGLRIGVDGNVEQACLVADEAEDDALAACVLETARRLAFPAPEPAGVVDVELPLVLRPNSTPAQPAVCEARPLHE